MKCKNCSAEIPPQWAHAINTNICPSCGDEIMSRDELGVLAEVRDAVSQMNANPEGLAGWLLSHYRLIKIGDAEPTQFFSTTKENAPASPQARNEEKNNLLKQFLNRAGVKVQDSNEIKKKISIPNVEMEDDEEFEEDDYVDEDEEVFVPATGQGLNSAIDPRDSFIQKQKLARKALSSGGGKFSR